MRKITTADVDRVLNWPDVMKEYRRGETTAVWIHKGKEAIEVVYEGEKHYATTLLAETRPGVLGVIAEDKKQMHGGENLDRLTDLVERIIAIQSVKPMPNFYYDMKQLGFIGSKIELLFSEPIATRYSKKPKTRHKVILFWSNGTLNYSLRGSTGYDIDSLPLDKLTRITKLHE